MNSIATRLEHDLLGDREVPALAYYGVHTLRALENFDITGISIAVYPDLIRALAQIKQAAAQANRQLGLLDARRADAIVAACKEVIDGQWHDQFVVDVIQGGLNRWWWWRDLRVPQESIPGEQIDADQRRWDVAVPANGKTELTVTFLTAW